VGFHHQALLIAALWPEGKGNVGAGASVGCNHTSRAPDQELWSAEGLFFGLGVKVVYPSDFTGSPYSILACGVTMPAQQMSFPFALVTTPSARPEDLPLTYNEIAPGWLLSDNLFVLKRNEAKFKSRSRAGRTAVPFEVLRPDTVDLMRDACRRLEAVRQVQSIYTDRDIAGLGKNFLTEANRQRAIAAYRFHTRYYALCGLLEPFEADAEALQQSPAELERLLTSAAGTPRWEHQRQLRCELGCQAVVPALRELEGMLEVVAREVERSKTKDDVRGEPIIADYAAVRVAADADAVVQQTWCETRQRQEQVRNLLLRLQPVRLKMTG
jgi:hypothetical protein